MFAELVCLETTLAKWHGGASIFRGLAQRIAIQQAFLDDPLVRSIAIFNTVGLYRRDRSIRT
jgi:hypothetical protein